MPARVRTTSRAAAEAGVREVYVAHYGRLAGWVNKLVGDQDLAHDIATECFVKLLTHWDEVIDPRPWLYTAASNVVKDHWRKRGRESAAYERHELLEGPSREDMPARTTGPDQATRLTIRDAVVALPDRLRMPVLLFYFADLSVAQVAAELGMSDGAVKRYLFEARGRLAETLEGVA